jgi:hypothetical protein
MWWKFREVGKIECGRTSAAGQLAEEVGWECDG